ncbi:MAG: hypothetical protein Q9M40_07360 [Sulfurimonas sp.]|nr:hypothetical protein [Sulfurimonas sp.]
MKSLKLIIVLFLTGTLFCPSLSGDIRGTGFGETHKEAKKEALSDLSQVIKSEVYSHIESHSTNKGSSTKSTIKISSNLPIMGS